jgi:curved DNA-binding protein
MSVKEARAILGLKPLATQGELRRAFREAAKAAHPDRPGGDAERFRKVVEAHHLLQSLKPSASASSRLNQPPVAVSRPGAATRGDTLSVPPLLAMTGGSLDHRLADGRRIRIALPAGLRAGDRLRAGGVEFEIAVRGDGQMMVRGDDLWITVAVEPHMLAEGGRVALDTPLGRRVVWITRKAGERGLVRLVGQGLPARGRHRQGHLFLRLAPQERKTDTAARTLLRRFTAAWAA